MISRYLFPIGKLCTASTASFTDGIGHSSASCAKGIYFGPTYAFAKGDRRCLYRWLWCRNALERSSLCCIPILKSTLASKFTLWTNARNCNRCYRNVHL